MGVNQIFSDLFRIHLRQPLLFVEVKYEEEEVIICLPPPLEGEYQLRENALTGKIFVTLKNRFPNVAEEELKAEACKLSTCNEEDWKEIVKRINQENENNKPGAVFDRFRQFPSQQFEVEGEEVVHQYIAGLHFYRMMAKWTQPGADIPVPLRKVDSRVKKEEDEEKEEDNKRLPFFRKSFSFFPANGMGRWAFNSSSNVANLFNRKWTLLACSLAALPGRNAIACPSDGSPRVTMA